eukprot:COSAG01_NODE_9123_length_2544_cov_88.350359_2_plen_90_part_00
MCVSNAAVAGHWVSQDQWCIKLSCGGSWRTELNCGGSRHYSGTRWGGVIVCRVAQRWLARYEILEPRLLFGYSPHSRLLRVSEGEGEDD